MTLIIKICMFDVYFLFLWKILGLLVANLVAILGR
jgi:hypothetical protein